MNRILAVLCGVCLFAFAGVVTYILAFKNAPVQSRPTMDQPRAEIADARAQAETLRQGRVVADGLDNPTGMALQPETGHIFVSLRDRIVRIVPGDSYTVHDEITGFPTDRYGKGPTYEFGPLGLAFADKNTLVVGDGGQPDGKEIVRIYTVGPEPLPRDKVLKAEQMTSYSTPIPPGEESFQGEGNFFGVALHGNIAFITCNGDDSKGWIARLELDLKKRPPLPLVPYIQSKPLTETNAPMGATMSPEGKLVVCQFGATNTFPNSLLTFYDPSTGKLTQKLKTGLRDLISVAYQPETGKLYGLDFCWAAPTKGGLYRLDVGDAELKVVKMADLVKPTALAFTPAGELIVAILGADADKGKKTGQLLIFTGL